MNLRLAKKNRKINPESWERLYAGMVVGKIRSKKKEDHGMGFSVNDEVAVLRKEIARLTEAIQALNLSYKPSEEFSLYNAGVEHCKALIKADIEIERGVPNEDGVQDS